MVARSYSVSEAARVCHEATKGGWANKRHSDSWLASLESNIFPAFGANRVDQITSVMVRDALAPIWLAIPESARRILQRVRTVLDYSHIEGWCPHEAALRSVTKGLPRQPTEEGDFLAMPFADVPSLVTELDALPETAGRDALLFTLLNAVRSGETRLAIWPEFDIVSAVWSIPAPRMKMKKAHVVPLSPAAVTILKRRLPLRLDDKGLVFSTHGTRPLSDMTMTKVLRDARQRHSRRLSIPQGFQEQMTRQKRPERKKPSRPPRLASCCSEADISLRFS